jgi:uncharacterized protein
LNDLKKINGYVLITGASSGLGMCYAKRLAQQGFNLIISARRKAELEFLEKDLIQTYSVDVRIVVADLANNGVAVISSFLSNDDLPIVGLVNNAGFGICTEFSIANLKTQQAMCEVNMTSLVCLTHAMLPYLKQQQDAFIINVASVAAYQAGPYMAVYYATKAFVLSFSEALYEELKSLGISVSCVCPGPTATEFAQRAGLVKKKLFRTNIMLADEVVKSSLANRHRAVVITGFMNKLMVYLGTFVPRSLKRKIARYLQK